VAFATAVIEVGVVSDFLEDLFDEIIKIFVSFSETIENREKARKEPESVLFL